ncbi:tripartite tricarboxylate transporter TctA family protein [Leptotrichia sp. OH3620_COT-345]|uniref:tripartite tricarboxylate transporter permease n=1 Tax=Leptotrichia sp. OH3620_COT-345 TaxID=2491048 RepID=UPI000F646FEB|nr:tripartite tricarboxylate transporter permease [Leptotrichia sp. OH3620_COT-345]RRD39367.1 tripartite tricarboxylate transporter TctA family protein [Leptotrichia sp. OH3620_COT-345]
MIFEIVIAALAAVFIYTVIGFVPGTDETSVLLPITLMLVLAGASEVIILSFFISAIITLNLINLMPAILVGLPGGVMSTPMIESGFILKKKGLSATVIKKMALSAVIATFISIIISLLLANALVPFGESIKAYSKYFFVAGAVFLSLISKNKALCLISIIPGAILVMALRHLYYAIEVVPPTKNITTSFFIGITIGPLFVSMISLLNKESLKEMEVKEYDNVILPESEDSKKVKLTKEEMKISVLSSVIVNFLFVLSPVGLLILSKELIGKGKDETISHTEKLVGMGAIAQATYLSGIIISLFGLGIPLSPAAIGPGAALFEAGDRFKIGNNIHNLLPKETFIITVLISALIAAGLSYFLITRYAFKITYFVMTRIPHEAVLAVFVSFILLLSYMEAGIINIFGVFLIGLYSGFMNKLGVNYGVQFMTLYASSFIVQIIGGI